MPERRSKAGLVLRSNRSAAGLAMRPERRSVSRVIDEQHYAALMRIVETEVLPRVLLSLGDAHQPARQPETTASLNSEVATFADVLLYGDRCAAQAFLREARQHGVSLADMYLAVIAPAARMICARWESDTCSFKQVAGGLVRLLSVMRDVGVVNH